MWIFGRKGESGFSSSSTAEEVTHGIDGSCLTAIVTGATSGIGAETARVLALRGVHVVWSSLLTTFDYLRTKPSLIHSIQLDFYRMWIFGRKGESGFSSSSTAEEVTNGIDGSHLTAIVTGATAGIGAETARILAMRGVHVVMAIRNTEVGRKVRETILAETPDAKIDLMELDLSSQASVREFATRYCSSGLPLHILINNAGVLAPKFTLSKDKIELHFATNHLGHFLLTNLLLETMKITSHEQKIEGRIINVSSAGHRFVGNMTFSDQINNESRYNHIYAYDLSKLANILHTKELSRLFKEEGVNITANSLHPGFIVTDLFRNFRILSFLFNFNTISRHVAKDVSQGAATTCYLALNPKVDGVSGEYFSDCNLAKPSSKATNPELAKELWEFSLSLTS